MPPLPQSFFARPVDELARELLGCRIRRGPVILRITEVEAYGGPEDTASHARFGRTERNAPMWGRAGRVYVYQCYGIHQMLNITAGQPGEASAVLIRACEPVAGHELILERRGARRGARSGPILLSGPGKVGAALDLDVSWSGHPLHRSGGLTLLPRLDSRGLLAGPRVGIEFAEQSDREQPWRFAEEGTAWVSHPRGLRAARFDEPA